MDKGGDRFNDLNTVFLSRSSLKYKQPQSLQEWVERLKRLFVLMYYEVTQPSATARIDEISYEYHLISVYK